MNDSNENSFKEWLFNAFTSLIGYAFLVACFFGLYAAGVKVYEVLTARMHAAETVPSRNFEKKMECYRLKDKTTKELGPDQLLVALEYSSTQDTCIAVYQWDWKTESIVEAQDLLSDKLFESQRFDATNGIAFSGGPAAHDYSKSLAQKYSK